MSSRSDRPGDFFFVPLSLCDGMHLWSPQSGATLLPTSRHDHIVQVPCGVPPAVTGVLRCAKQKLLNLKHGPKKAQMCLVHYEKVTLCHIDKNGSIQISFHPAGTKTTSPGCATPQIKCFGFCVRYCQGGRSGGRLPPWCCRPHWGFLPMVQSIDIIL